MTDILQLLDSVIDQVGEERCTLFPQFPSCDALQRGTGIPKSLIESAFLALPAVPVDGDDIYGGTNPNIASTIGKSDKPDGSALPDLSFRNTGNSGTTGKTRGILRLSAFP